MKKCIKTILLVLIIFFSMFFMFQNNISAGYSGDGGVGEDNKGNAGNDGAWTAWFGFYIKVYDQNDNQRGGIIDVYLGHYSNPKIGETKVPELKGWIKNSNGYKVNPKKLYDYLDIPYEDVVNDYSTLLKILNDAKKELDIGDYIIIEPYTVIGSTNFTFRELITTDRKYKGNPYFGWYHLPARLLADAAKVGTTITAGNKTFTAPSGTCTLEAYKEKKFCGYSTDENIGYGITVLRYDDIFQHGKVKINIKRNDTKQLITSKTAKFRIYDSAGTMIKDVDTGSSGVAEHALEDGTYKIEEFSSPGNYELSSAKTVWITIVASQVTEIDYLYDTTCAVDLEDLGANPTPSDLINLYKKYSDNGNLLNFSSPSCSKAQCDTSILSNISCLSGKKALSSTFNENNLSCYDEVISDGYSLIGFCSDYFELKNNLNTNTFYTTAGQFIIRQDNNVLKIYDNKLNPVTINSKYVAIANVGKVCYILSGKKFDPATNVKTSNVYFGDVNGDNQIDTLNNDSIIKTNSQTNAGIFTKYTYELENKYSLSEEVYLEKITGKYSSTKTNNTISQGIYGILSKFNDSSGSIPFSLIYNGKTYNPSAQNKCNYIASPEIVKFDEVETGKLELEFRSIDTKLPFDRDTNTNWCANGNCAKNNNLIKNVILNRNNSYNTERKAPKYKIILTSSDITKIRQYNSGNQYDSYELYCDRNNKCTNAFLKSLMDGVLNGYGNLTNKLIVQNS